jgi:uroporphyrinogen III methyltransferase / synthase
VEIRSALAGRRIVVTRAPGQSEGLKQHLAKVHGAAVIELPCVEFRELEETGPLDNVIRSLKDYAWILFTSQNAVRFFARRCRTLRIEFGAFGDRRPKIGAIGPATAEAAAAEGFSPDFVPPAGTGRSFAGIFKECVRGVAGLESKNPALNFARELTGMKVLIPRSDSASRDHGVADWTEVLREAGAEVTSIVAYRTRMPESLRGPQLDEVLRAGADCFVFASPSAFKNLARSVSADDLRRLASSAAFAAIGPTTAAAIRAAEIECAIESPKPDVVSVATAIAEHFQGSSSGRMGKGVQHA